MAWSIVGVSTSVEVAVVAHTLTEPAGCTTNDLLVACISVRTTATTGITLPSGWTLVNQQMTNNALTTGSAISSGCMAYIVRGASAPALGFTHPAGISVALGRIVAYRGNALTSVLDVSTAVTTAVSTTAVSVAGLTTTQADDLIVTMAAGGQEAAWSSFNATTPAGASGATDTTTAPSATWRERAEQVTTTGNDTSLGVFDALKTTAGATGNLTVTASVAAGHVVIGGAFKILPVASGSIAYRSHTLSSYASRSAGLDLDKPAGVTTDDIMLAVVVHAKGPPAQNDLVQPAGWTKIGTSTVVADVTLSAKLEVWWKRATGSEPATYFFDIWGTSSNQYGIIAYSGCIASGDPIDVFSTNSANTGSTATGTAVTTTGGNDMLVWLGHNWDGTGALTAPSGMTERFDNLLFGADQTIASASATGNRTQTLASSNPWATYMLALKPAAAGGGGGTVKVRIGAAWVAKPVKIWTGSAWVSKPVKVWSGSAWVTKG